MRRRIDALARSASGPLVPEALLNESLPLSDVRVVEFSHMVMGPAAGLILADLGADVLKIEPVGGDNTRRLKGSGGGYFAMYNRNKQSLCVDLKQPRGQALVLRLIEDADVLIENFRPGAMDRLGFGYAALSETHPRLIYCSLKGFLSGPYEHRPALDEVTQMLGGLAYMTGLPGRPMRAGASVVDVGGGMFGVIGILAALNQRRSTGRGQHLTSALFETTAFFVGQHMAQEAVLGQEPQPMSIRHSAWGVYDLFTCAGDAPLFVGVVTDGQWRHFCAEFELDALAEDATLATNAGRVAERERFLPALRDLFAGMGRAEAAARLERAGLPFAEVNRPSDLFDDPHLSGKGLADLHVADGDNAGKAMRLPKLPLEMDGSRMDARRDLPRAGEHSRAAVARTGEPPAAIAALLEAGVIAEN